MEALPKDHKLELTIANRDGSTINYTIVVNNLTNEETSKSYNVSVSAADVAKIKDSKIQYLATHSNINGFRPGKAPVAFIWKKHKDELTYEIIDEIVNSSVNGIALEQKLDVVSNPKTSNEELDLDKTIKFDVSFITLPEITFPDFTKLTIEKPVYEITDKDIQSRVKKLLTMNKKYDTAKKTHKAALGDKVVIDFEGKIDGVLFAGGSAQGHTIELGSHSFIDTFEDQLVGKKSGDEVLVKVTFPAEYHAKEFAGKPAEFAVTIHEILESRDLKDETELLEAAKLTSVEELHTQIRNVLEKECKNIQTMKMKSSLLDQLDAVFLITPPQIMLDDELANLMKQVDKLDKEGKSEEELNAEYIKLAKRRVKLGILLAEVAKKNDISVEQKDITQAITERALSAGSPEYAQAIMQYFLKNKQAIEQLKGPIIESKTVHYLFEQVKNKDKKTTVTELLELED